MKVLIKKKRLTEEEKKKRQTESRRTQYARQKAALAKSKALKKKKVPYTAEEKAEKERIRLETVEEKRRELAINTSPAIPLGQVLTMIQDIGTEEVSYRTEIPENILKSWVHRVWQPRGKMAETLQEYLKSVKYRKKAR